MAGRGPTPDPDALRRDRDGAGAAWLVLPRVGRQGAPPKWPLTRATKRELTLWAREWRRPQAVEWARCGQELEVGLYVRSFAAAEAHDATAAARTLVRLQADALGLTLLGLARLRWRIADHDGATAQPISRARSVRDRFAVVPRGPAATDPPERHSVNRPCRPLTHRDDQTTNLPSASRLLAHTFAPRGEAVRPGSSAGNAGSPCGAGLRAHGGHRAPLPQTHTPERTTTP